MSGEVYTARRRRGVPLVALAVLLTPVVELLVVVLLVRQLGGWPTFGVVVASTALGALLLARQAPRSWRALREATRVERLQQGRMPGPELLDAAVVLAGAVLLAVPGVVSDVLGLVCLLPLTRPLPRRLLQALVQRRAAAAGHRVRRPGPGLRRNVVAGDVVSGEVVTGGGLDVRPPRGSGGEAGRAAIEGEVLPPRDEPGA